MAVLPQLIYRVNWYKLHQKLSRLFCGNEQADPKVYGEVQRVQNSQNSFEKNKKNKIVLPIFQTSYEATVIKMVILV